MKRKRLAGLLAVIGLSVISIATPGLDTSSASSNDVVRPLRRATSDTVAPVKNGTVGGPPSSNSTTPGRSDMFLLPCNTTAAFSDGTVVIGIPDDNVGHFKSMPICDFPVALIDDVVNRTFTSARLYGNKTANYAAVQTLLSTNTTGTPDVKSLDAVNDKKPKIILGALSPVFATAIGVPAYGVWRFRHQLRQRLTDWHLKPEDFGVTNPTDPDAPPSDPGSPNPPPSDPGSPSNPPPSDPGSPNPPPSDPGSPSNPPPSDPGSPNPPPSDPGSPSNPPPSDPGSPSNPPPSDPGSPSPPPSDPDTPPCSPETCSPSLPCSPELGGGGCPAPPDLPPLPPPAFPKGPIPEIPIPGTPWKFSAPLSQYPRVPYIDNPLNHEPIWTPLPSPAGSPPAPPVQIAPEWMYYISKAKKNFWQNYWKEGLPGELEGRLPLKPHEIKAIMKDRVGRMLEDWAGTADAASTESVDAFEMASDAVNSGGRSARGITTDAVSEVSDFITMFPGFLGPDPDPRPPSARENAKRFVLHWEDYVQKLRHVLSSSIPDEPLQDPSGDDSPRSSFSSAPGSATSIQPTKPPSSGSATSPGTSVSATRDPHGPSPTLTAPSSSINFTTSVPNPPTTTRSHGLVSSTKIPINSTQTLSTTTFTTLSSSTQRTSITSVIHTTSVTSSTSSHTSGLHTTSMALNTTSHTSGVHTTSMASNTSSSTHVAVTTTKPTSTPTILPAPSLPKTAFFMAFLNSVLNARLDEIKWYWNEHHMVGGSWNDDWVFYAISMLETSTWDYGFRPGNAISWPGQVRQAVRDNYPDWIAETVLNNRRLVDIKMKTLKEFMQEHRAHGALDVDVIRKEICKAGREIQQNRDGVRVHFPGLKRSDVPLMPMSSLLNASSFSEAVFTSAGEPRFTIATSEPNFVVTSSDPVFTIPVEPVLPIAPIPTSLPEPSVTIAPMPTTLITITGRNPKDSLPLHGTALPTLSRSSTTASLHTKRGTNTCKPWTGDAGRDARLKAPHYQPNCLPDFWRYLDPEIVPSEMVENGFVYHMKGFPKIAPTEKLTCLYAASPAEEAVVKRYDAVEDVHEITVYMGDEVEKTKRCLNHDPTCGESDAVEDVHEATVDMGEEVEKTKRCLNHDPTCGESDAVEDVHEATVDMGEEVEKTKRCLNHVSPCDGDGQ